MIVAGLFLLGLPGAVYASLTEPVVAPLRGVAPGEILAGDRAWPIAILMTMAVPPVLPVAWWLSHTLQPAASGVVRVITVTAAFYIWSAAVLLALSL